MWYEYLLNVTYALVTQLQVYSPYSWVAEAALEWLVS